MSEEKIVENITENTTENTTEKKQKPKKLPIDYKLINMPLKTPAKLTSEQLPAYFEEGFKYNDIYVFPEIKESKMQEMQGILPNSRLTIFYESKKKKIVVYGNSKFSFYSKFPCLESAIPERPHNGEDENSEEISQAS